MKKVYQIVFYYRQSRGPIAHESNVLFENKANAELIANKIAKEKHLFYKLVEYYI